MTQPDRRSAVPRTGKAAIKEATDAVVRILKATFAERICAFGG